jgi:V8-like Glu-specific endopeptidase
MLVAVSAAVFGPTACVGATHPSPVARPAGLIRAAHAAPPSAATANAGSSRTAHAFTGTRTVGALFLPHTYPTLHTCTASVVRSRSHDLIVTAAHCLRAGSARGYMFAPGYHDGRTPNGVWRVTAGYASPQWIHQRAVSTQRDWAFLRVAGQRRKGKTMRVQDVVGGNRLGAAPKPRSRVRVPGYVIGSLDKPITCRARVYFYQGYPAFNCGGYQGGVSGSPWLAGHGTVRTIAGIIGGLHQGGCSPATSYSSKLGRAAHVTLRRAARHGRADTFPAPPGDGC